MQLNDLVGKSLEEMSDEELLEKLRQTRHNRNNQRPKVTKKAATSQAKARHKRVSAVQGMLAGLSEEERTQLIQQLEGEGDATDDSVGEGVVE